MQLITLDQFIENQQFFIQEAKSGKTFIYPTDTVYGIGWIYTPDMVNKIFAIKQRDVKKMFSIIAPNFDWILKNYVNDSEHVTWATANILREAKNHETIIETLKQYLAIYHGVTYIFDYHQPGIRIIKHPFQTFVENLGEAFITTSCNLAGEPTVTETQNIPAELSDRIDYIINAWPLEGKPSVLIDLVENKIIER